jgi:peptidoglycan lytic transglycosylase
MFLIRYALVLLSASFMAAATAADDAQAVRAAFRQAYDAARNPVATVPSSQGAALRQYALYPYLEAARLEAALSAGRANAAQAAAEFLKAHGEEPVTIQLRRALLLASARCADWSSYLEFYPDGFGDQSLVCRALTARMRLGDTAGLEQAAVREWLTPHSADDACDPVFDWLRSRNVLDTDLIERRARLALDAGETPLARWLAKSLPASRATALNEWVKLLEQPRPAIDRLIASPGTRVDFDALLAGWSRLARRDADAAIARFDPLVRARALTDGERSRLARALALALAWSRRPEALGYFARIEPADFDDMTHEWHARAALWAGAWPRVTRAIDAMPFELREQTRWRYWGARAAEQAGDERRARELYAEVISTDNYYALQSAARNGVKFEPHLNSLSFDPARIDALANLPAFARARELMAIEEPHLAEREWRYGYERLDETQRIAAVGLASRWDWYFATIATAADQRQFNDYPLLYPRPYDSEVDAAARATGVSDDLIYAVIRQESLYQPYAASTAGALGLMQLLPGTASKAARTLNERPPSRAALADPAVNIRLGAATLRELMDRFDGRTEVVLAGYNAGPGAARRWMPDAPLDADIWIENIPYNETRAYVQRVLWHRVVFAWVREDTPQDVSEIIARVEPSPGASAATGGT